MQPLSNVELRNFSTMRLGGKARYLTEVTGRQDVSQAINWAFSQKLPIIMIGGGSNIVWRDEGFPGLVLVNRIKQFEIFDEDETNSYVTIGSGENWDSVVAQTVAHGLTGIEALSLIPGTSGATPIQNVGAYGQEIAQSLTAVEAYDTQTNNFVTLPAADCQFSYRSSRFKAADHGRFYITSITLHLMKMNPLPPYYPAVQHYFEENGITTVTPALLREAVIAIRKAKLPDPAQVANCGSFFANPLVSKGVFSQLQAASDGEEIPHWSTADPDSIKLSAAWLIEKAGFKEFHDPETGMATWPKQPLVLINEAAKSTADLLRFKEKIVAAVAAQYEITLNQEPELLP